MSSVERKVGRVAAAAVTVVAMVGGTRPLVAVVAVAITAAAIAVVAAVLAVVAAKPNQTRGLVVPAARVDVEVKDGVEVEDGIEVEDGVEVEDGIEVVLAVLEEAALEVGCMGGQWVAFPWAPFNPLETVKLGLWALF